LSTEHQDEHAAATPVSFERTKAVERAFDALGERVAQFAPLRDGAAKVQQALEERARGPVETATRLIAIGRGESPDIKPALEQARAEWNRQANALWAAGERPARAEAAALEGLIARVAAIVRNAWRSHMGDCDVDDAVQDSLLATLQSLRDPRHGYTYEADLLSWLVRAALDRLHAQWRERRRMEALPEWPREAPAPPDELEHVRRLQEWQERYLLVQFFFRSHVRERVKAIWEAIVLADASGGRPSDDELRAARRGSDRPTDPARYDALLLPPHPHAAWRTCGSMAPVRGSTPIVFVARALARARSCSSAQIPRGESSTSKSTEGTLDAFPQTGAILNPREGCCLEAGRFLWYSK